MQRIEKRSGLNKIEMQKLEQELIGNGYVKVDHAADLTPNQYQISSFTGDENTFGGETKYNFSWCSQ